MAPPRRGRHAEGAMRLPLQSGEEAHWVSHFPLLFIILRSLPVIIQGPARFVTPVDSFTPSS